MYEQYTNMLVIPPRPPVLPDDSSKIEYYTSQLRDLLSSSERPYMDFLSTVVSKMDLLLSLEHVGVLSMM